MAEQGQQEKTEQATPRRREEARKEGNVPRSKEITSAFLLMGAALALLMFSPGIARRLTVFQGDMYEWIARTPSDVSDAMAIMSLLGRTIAASLAPILLSVAAVAAFVGWAQGGGAMSTKSIEPKFSHLNPLEGFKRIYGWRAAVNLLKQVLRLVVVASVAYATISALWAEMLALSGAPPEAVLGAIYRFTLRLIGFTGAAYLLLAVADYGFEFWEHEKKLMMTKEEIKQEMKNTDGDPLLKQKIRDTMRQIARGRMMRDIPAADVVIANPTHRAIALRYKPENDSAPIVVAMGERKLALKIREIAERHDIPVVVDRSLAKALIKTATVGYPIPPELYKAVAEVLMHIYRARYETYYGRTRS